jgi:probable HAF family extracellular repeat protein
MKYSNCAALCVVTLALAASASSAEDHTTAQHVDKRAFRLELLESVGGAPIESATGVNDAGQVAGGIGVDWNGVSGRTVVWRDGSVTEIPAPPNTVFFGSAISRTGEVAGTLISQSRDEHAAIWSNARITDLDDSRQVYASRVTGVNAKGQVVGWTCCNGNPTATLWDRGTVVDLGALLKKEGYSEAHAINDAGQIVGQIDERAKTKAGAKLLGTYAVLWQGTTATLLPTLAGTNASANGINDRGQIVGVSTIRGRGGRALDFAAHGTLWTDNGVIDLGGFPGFERTSAQAINNAGEIVGSADNRQFSAGLFDPDDHHAVYWDGTKRIVDLNHYLPKSLSGAGWVLTEAVSINNVGAIVGNAYNRQTGARRAFLLRPTKP